MALKCFHCSHFTKSASHRLAFQINNQSLQFSSQILKRQMQPLQMILLCVTFVKSCQNVVKRCLYRVICCLNSCMSPRLEILGCWFVRKKSSKRACYFLALLIYIWLTSTYFHVCKLQSTLKPERGVESDRKRPICFTLSYSCVVRSQELCTI